MSTGLVDSCNDCGVSGEQARLLPWEVEAQIIGINAREDVDEFGGRGVVYTGPTANLCDDCYSRRAQRWEARRQYLLHQASALQREAAGYRLDQNGALIPFRVTPN